MSIVNISLIQRMAVVGESVAQNTYDWCTWKDGGMLRH